MCDGDTRLNMRVWVSDTRMWVWAGIHAPAGKRCEGAEKRPDLEFFSIIIES